MLRLLIRLILRGLLHLRYSIEITGRKKVAEKGSRGILFLPNHPALIDPVILTTVLNKKFRPRPLADAGQVNRRFIRKIVNLTRPIIIPDLFTYGRSGRDVVVSALEEIVNGLKQGDNLIIYPSGRLYRGYREEIGGNSAVERIIKEMPDVRIVLVRTTGLWGSSFSRADGKIPTIKRHLKKYLFSVLANGIFFVPRRKVLVELIEPENLPRQAGRLEINNYLEQFYNEKATPNTYVPYFWWQGRNPKTLPEIKADKISGDAQLVPESTKKLVIDYLERLTEISGIRIKDRLAGDLGIDSLSMIEVMVWLENEFGMPQEDMEALHTVGDCLLAAYGKSIGRKLSELKSVSKAWFENSSKRPLFIHRGETIAEAFLNQAKSDPARVLIADQIIGTVNNQDIVMRIMALKPQLERLSGKNIGIMLPPGVIACLSYLTALFAGKTPVMVNWTMGEKMMIHCLKQAGVEHIVTARAMIEKLRSQGLNYSRIDTNWFFLEDAAKNITLKEKISSLVKSRISWGSLYHTNISDTAAILFTSGSEAYPKGVPLSHENILANLKDFADILTIYDNDRLLGMLPPFHSLGLSGTVVLPLCMGIKTIYHSNPTEAAILGRLIGAYKVSLLIGTPTFLNGIIRASSPEKLKHLRLIFTGAEKCPDYVYDALHEICPKAVMCEGYGVTECSPLISVNHDNDPKQGTIGKVLPSIDYAIVHPETGLLEKTGNPGILIVRGPNIFSGYLKDTAVSPFVEFEGKEWYSTGDLVREDASGVLTFCGRLKRFIKLGGEMISLPAIESALNNHFPAEDDKGPVLAVEATPSEEHPEIVLFTTLQIEREEANRIIREEGISALYNIRRLVKVEGIPVLGTGKIDYRQLKEGLNTTCNGSA